MNDYPWHSYTKKMRDKIEHPYAFGHFCPEEAEAMQMRYVEGKQGLLEDGNVLHFYWLVDPTDGVIVDARFQVFGQTPLIAAAEVACSLLIGKNYDQAKRLSGELIDKQLRDHPESAAFTESTLAHLNLVIDVIDDAVHQCLDLPLSATYVSPLPELEAEAYPGWEELSHERKIAVLEQVIQAEIRPYIELDAGGIEIVELKEDNELIIRYQGSCTSCFSAVGSTLSAIQHIIQSKVHPSLKVSPDLSTLQL
ncbi:MAG: NifU family protein [Verrucomicrobia bacterium]|nr:NifU family protein [Verrucomicrobiota bacterium]MBS0645378.1 NifU family protein [Verrucomicrobiota bacterium]